MAEPAETGTHAELKDDAIRRAGTAAIEKLLGYGLELGIVSEVDGRRWLSNVVDKLQAYLDTAPPTPRRVSVDTSSLREALANAAIGLDDILSDGYQLSSKRSYTTVRVFGARWEERLEYVRKLLVAAPGLLDEIDRMRIEIAAKDAELVELRAIAEDHDCLAFPWSNHAPSRIEALRTENRRLRAILEQTRGST